MDFQVRRQSLGTSVKLFGSSRIDGEQVHAWVAPVMIGRDHVLYSVSDVFNGVMVKGNMVGTTMFYGSGAGKLPTASAVVADIIAAVRHKNMNIAIGWSEERQTIAPMDTSSYRYFVRVDGNCEENRSRGRSGLWKGRAYGSGRSGRVCICNRENDGGCF